MVQIGIEGRQEIIVSEEITAKHIGSGTVLVLSTPMMIALMERTCRMSVKPYLEDGQETVGTHVNVSHESAVGVGEKVWCESEVAEVDRRKICFNVAVFSEKGIVGRGTHERFIIDEKRFGEKISSR